MESYDILWNSKKVGQAKIISEGLYNNIICSCHFEVPGIYRIRLQSDMVDLPLGVCIPEDQQFVLRKKVPLKYFYGNILRFVVQSDHQSAEQKIMINSPGCEIPISMLKHMCLKTIAEKVYLVIT